MLYLQSPLFAQKKVADSLLQVINSTDSIDKVDAMYDLAYLMRTTNPDTSILLGEQMEPLAKELDYIQGIGDANAIQGIGYTAIGDYYKALRYFLNAQEQYQLIDAKNSVAGNLNNIGRVYNFIEDYDQALSYYEESAIRFAELKNLRQEGHILNNIGYIHKLRGKYDKALDYLRRSLKRGIDVKDHAFIVYPTYNIGSTYVLLNQIDSAHIYLDKAEALALEYRNRYILSLTNLDRGILFAQLNKEKEALNNLQRAYQVAKEVGMRSEQRDAAKHLSVVYENTNQYETALQYFKIYKSLNDSLINNDVTHRIAFQEAESEFNQRQLLEESQRKGEELLKEQALANAILMRNSLLGGLIFMLIISYLLYINFSRKRKANEELRLLNQKIELQAEELRQANKEITVINSNLEQIVNQRTEELKRKNKQLREYLSDNSHIVRAPLARILGLVDLYDVNDLDNLEFINKSLHESATELDNALREINDKLSE